MRVLLAIALGLLGLTVLPLLGCGAGVVTGLIAGSGDDGNDSPPIENSAPRVVEIELKSTETSPAVIDFRLRDDESDPVDVQILYRAPGLDPKEITFEKQTETRLSNLRTNSEGVRHSRMWDYRADLGTENGARGDVLAEDIAVMVRILRANRGSPPEIDAPVAETTTSLGNALPIVQLISPKPQDQVELTRGVSLGLFVRDDDRHTARLRIEFRIVGDPEHCDCNTADTSCWQVARDASLPDEIPTPRFQRTGIQFDDQGTAGVFFPWDTAFPPLANRFASVQLRFTVEQELDSADEPLSTQLLVPACDDFFVVDNNPDPQVCVDGDAVFVNPDATRGIPIPFRIQDPDGDRLRVVFQWRRARTQSFGGQDPELVLPNQVEDFEKILNDPVRRSEAQIATEIPASFVGRPIADRDTTVRLPELASSAAGIVPRDLVGRELELLRGLTAPVEVELPENTLARPVAALPVGDGRSAIVLENPEGGRWRLREIELASLEARDIAAANDGNPSAMTYERGDECVLVASDLGGLWTIQRVELGSGRITALVSLMPGESPLLEGRVRGVASLGSCAAVITVGSSLVRLDYEDPTPIAVLLSDFEQPWGIALDPIQTNHIYLAEHAAGGGRVIKLALDSLARVPIATLAIDGSEPAVPRPEAIAVENPGHRLLVVTDADPDDDTRELTAIELGDVTAGNICNITGALSGEVGAVSAGPDGLRLVALTGRNRLAVGGGLQQKRAISSYDETTQVVTVDEPFLPALDQQRWRIRNVATTFRARPETGLDESQVFVWNSEDVPGGGSVVLRAIALDEEVVFGGEAATTLSKSVGSSLSRQPLVLTAPRMERPRIAVAADLNDDGKLDIASANQRLNTLAVFFQRQLEGFDAAVDILDLVEQQQLKQLDPLGTALSRGRIGSIESVQAADMNGDGRNDLVSVHNGEPDEIYIYFQIEKGQFAETQLRPNLDGTTEQSPFVVEVADLNGDGALDFVVGTRNGTNGLPGVPEIGTILGIFVQSEPGRFRASSPDVTIRHPLLREVQSIEAADLDGDGDVDLIAASADGDSDTFTLSLFRQDSGPGRIEFREREPVVFEETSAPRSVRAADLDGDGLLDLVSVTTAAADSSIVIRHQDKGSPGTFELRIPKIQDTRLDRPRFVEVADFDGDADLDLVTANRDGNTVTTFFQTRPDNFILADEITAEEIPAGNFRPSSVVAADLNEDARPDLVMTNIQQNFDSVVVVFQAAPSPTPSPVDLPLPEVPPPVNQLTLAPVPTKLARSRPPLFMEVADLDSDGDLDLASTVPHLNLLSIFRQRTPRTFDRFDLADDNLLEPRALTLADLNGDSRVDLVSANCGSDNLTVHLQGSVGSTFEPLAAADSVLLDPGARCPQAVRAADLDGDFDLDVVSANRFNTGTAEQGSLSVFAQGADHNFALQQALTHPSLLNPTFVEIGDLDGDGDLDLASANRNHDSVSLFVQNSPGTFSFSKSLADPSMQGPRSILLADLDSNGTLDLVAANERSNNLSILLQGRQMSFKLSPPINQFAEIVGPVFVAAADIDRDGDLDLISANERSNDLALFFQTTAGRFGLSGRRMVSDSVDAPAVTAAVDLDGDIDIDLLSANTGSNNLTVFFGGR